MLNKNFGPRYVYQNILDEGCAAVEMWYTLESSYFTMVSYMLKLLLKLFRGNQMLLKLKGTKGKAWKMEIGTAIGG
jgi:hypothetical protein